MNRADIVFTKSNSLLSNIIRYKTYGIWSHCMLATGRGNDVITADAEGVVCRAMREDEIEDHAILYYPGLTWEDTINIVRWSFSKIGSGYDFLGLASFLTNKDAGDIERWFCSELVFVAYLRSNIRLLKRMNHAFVTPQMIWTSPMLEYRW